MPASRAVEAEVHPARHCGETWPVPGTSLTTSAVRSPAQGSLSVMDVEYLDQAQSRLQCPKGPECLVGGSEIRWIVVRVRFGHLVQSAAAAWVRRSMKELGFLWSHTPTGHGDTSW